MKVKYFSWSTAIRIVSSIALIILLYKMEAFWVSAILASLMIGNEIIVIGFLGWIKNWLTRSW